MSLRSYSGIMMEALAFALLWDRNKVGNKMGLRPASCRTEKTGIENKVGNFQAENHAHRMN